MFKEMAELAEILRNKRMKRGAIDFDFNESKVLSMKTAGRLILFYGNVQLRNV